MQQKVKIETIVFDFMGLENQNGHLKISAEVSQEDIDDILRDQSLVRNLNKFDLAVYEMPNSDFYKAVSIASFPIYSIAIFALAAKFVLPKIKNDILAVSVGLGIVATALIASALTALAIYSLLAIKTKIITGAWLLLLPGEKVFYKKTKNDKKSSRCIEMTDAISINSPFGSPAGSFNNSQIMPVELPSFNPSSSIRLGRSV